MNHLSAGEDAPGIFHVVIEIGAGAFPVKYEVDKKTGLLMVDRFLSVSMQYPCNYGYIPSTLAGDGDPLDVLMIAPYPVIPGAYLEARPIGMLDMEDESGEDQKVVAVPTMKAAPLYKNWQDIHDMPDVMQKSIAHFFECYKALEPNKWVKVRGWMGKSSAEEAIMSAISCFNEQPTESSPV